MTLENTGTRRLSCDSDVTIESRTSPKIRCFQGEILYKNDGSAIVINDNQTHCDVTIEPCIVTKGLNVNANNNSNLRMDHARDDGQEQIETLANFLTFLDKERRPDQPAQLGFEPIDPEIRTFRVHTLDFADGERNEKWESMLLPDSREGVDYSRANSRYFLTLMSSDWNEQIGFCWNSCSIRSWFNSFTPKHENTRLIMSTIWGRQTILWVNGL